jgi:hypothetical protein
MSSFRDMFTKTPESIRLEEEKKLKEDKLQKDVSELYQTIDLLKDELLKKEKTKGKKEEVSISIQLLILHYLDYLNIENLNNKNKSVLLSVLLNTNGVENIRKKLSNVGGSKSPLLTLNNLIFLEKLFQKTNLNEALERVRKDISKISSK